jgi:integrase/recombinase XerD
MKAYLELYEVTKIERQATCVRDRLLIRMLFHLGCRISEALALRVEDISLSQGTITIQHLKTRIKLTCPQCNGNVGKSHNFCPKCGITVERAVAQAKEHRRMRTLPIDTETLEMLEDYIRRSGPVTRDGMKLIFGINRHRAWQIVHDCSERAGLPALVNPESGRTHGVSPHRFRDAFAVHAMRLDDSGDGLRLLQEHLGHASFNTTAKYRKVAGEEHREWYDRLWNQK